MSAPYRPGQPPWPENQQQRPDRPPPVPFHQEQAPGKPSPTDWALRIVGLVAVAVVSGFLWWFLTNESPPEKPTGFGGTPPPTEPAGGEFEFTPEIPEAIEDEDCADHAYGDIEDFLKETPCDRLIRAIYSTTIDGRTVYTSVSVVEMADEDTAKQLRELTDIDGSGNVNDLVREGDVDVPDLETLSAGGGYDSARDGREVIIVEADYDPNAAEGGTEEELDRVCSDAIRLAKEMVDPAG
ncbi:hypothetical protein [Actinophytocola gossypii]|uniref:DUF3558 domain-containing protein n=1 Tax=Actinophytocola gossypii TaxID=2812003 RepID=A0ABT2J9W4_9PSEU|nr:hypothetical protein [Actinophytocola gossypii]MCT2584662.1 hypothetical protein [Actinophytocola gossypii]